MPIMVPTPSMAADFHRERQQMVSKKNTAMNRIRNKTNDAVQRFNYWKAGLPDYLQMLASAAAIIILMFVFAIVVMICFMIFISLRSLWLRYH